MGGKTIVLKTLGMLQLLAQMGFFVPAKKFETVIFDKIFHIGHNALENITGLSSFGLEIFAFNQAYKNKNKKCLFLIDELAKTTNYIEARALLCAVVEIFCKNKNIYALFSTHITGITRKPNLGFYKMKGFDDKLFRKSSVKIHGRALADNLKQINRFMRYEIVEDKKNILAYDAIKIAKLLATNDEIIKLAYKFMEQENGQ